MAKAAEEEKAVTTKKPSEIVSRGEELEHWMERFMDDFWRRPFPSLSGRDRWLPIRPLSIRIPSLDVYEEKDSVVVKAELPGMKKRRCRGQPCRGNLDDQRREERGQRSERG